MKKSRHGSGVPVTQEGNGIPGLHWPASLAQVVSSRFSDGASFTEQFDFVLGVSTGHAQVCPSFTCSERAGPFVLSTLGFQSSWIPGTNLLWEEATDLSAGNRKQRSGGASPEPSTSDPHALVLQLQD